VAQGSDAAWAPATFPETLPEGIGCQRCHGAGARHVASVLGGRSLEEIRAAIVNPRRLTRDRRDDVCFQCHLQPSVAMMGLRKTGRGDYSFRPGEALSDYLLHVDIDEPGRARTDRFEINHHGYRLRQSACHRQGGLGCIDCHNPHVGLKQDTRLAQASQVCRNCHTTHPDLPVSAVDNQACTACHMPRRRTQDVVHVVMTDHGMPRHPPADALAPLAESEPSIEALVFLDPDSSPRGDEGEAYRARTVLQSVTSAAALDALLTALQRYQPEDPAPWMDAIAGELKLGRYRDAAGHVASALQRWPDQAQLHAWQGFVAIALGEPEAALDPLREAIRRSPRQAEFHLNLALALEQLGKAEAASASATQATALRPNLLPAWLTRARLSESRGDYAQALEFYQRVLALEPANTRAASGTARNRAALAASQAPDY
jgi:Flp pilus assembly protein TadD